MSDHEVAPSAATDQRSIQQSLALDPEIRKLEQELADELKRGGVRFDTYFNEVRRIEIDYLKARIQNAKEQNNDIECDKFLEWLDGYGGEYYDKEAEERKRLVEEAEAAEVNRSWIKQPAPRSGQVLENEGQGQSKTERKRGVEEIEDEDDDEGSDESDSDEEEPVQNRPVQRHRSS